MEMSNLPKIMTNANIDLAATSGGKFSPENWERILARAHAQLLENKRTLEETEAWQAVVRDFHVNGNWGFPSNYRAPAKPRKANLGFQLIWLMFASLTIVKVAIPWLGNIYTNSGTVGSKIFFFGALALVVGNIVWFLWRNRGYQD
jgi:hypothetical protein